MMLHTNIKALCLVVSDKKIIFSCFPYEYRYLLKAGLFPGDTCSGHLWSQGHHFNKLCRRPVDDATYQISMLYRQEEFSCFPYRSLCKTCDRLVGPFMAPES